jgi:hypothetical protein
MELLFSEARRAIISKQLNPIFEALFDADSAFWAGTGAPAQ